MLTFRQIDDIPDAVLSTIADVEQSIINDMSRRIAALGQVTSATEWQTLRMEAIGAQEEFIIKALSDALGITEKQLVELFDEAATRTLASDDRIYKAAGYEPVPLKENAYMQQLIAAGLAKTNGTFRNITATTAVQASQQFIQALDLAHMQITSGAFDYQTAIRNGVKSLTKTGLNSIRHASGRVDALDVAFRRATLTIVNQTAAQLQVARMDEMGCDVVETTAHAGARPTHQTWQGQWFSRTGNGYPVFQAATGYGTAEGLCGVNCRHGFFPVIPGLSDRA
ncbi:MAG: phage minor capsid protein, partial [Sporomusa sp.]